MEKTREFLSEHNLTAAHLEAIGLVASEWALLESELRVQMAAAVRLEKATWITVLTRGAGGRELAEIYKGLIEWGALVEEQGNALKPILEQIIALAAERNKYVHAFWVMDIDSGESFFNFDGPKAEANAVSMTQQGRRFTPIKVGHEEIRATARRIAEARGSLWKCLDATTQNKDKTTGDFA